MFALLLPACHGLAFISLQLSFQRGTTLATAGVSTLLTNILPILAGLIIFAEHLPGGVPGILRRLGFTSAILGAAMLARRGPPDHDDSTRPGERHRRQARATFPGTNSVLIPATFLRELAASGRVAEIPGGWRPGRRQETSCAAAVTGTTRRSGRSEFAGGRPACNRYPGEPVHGPDFCRVQQSAWGVGVHRDAASEPLTVVVFGARVTQ